MVQHELFDPPRPTARSESAPSAPLDVPRLLDRLTASCERPRYNFMLLTLIMEASASSGRAGPYVRVANDDVPIRDWLCDAMNPVGRREPRRLRMLARVRAELAAAGALPNDPKAAEQAVDAEVRERLRQSGRTNVSRAVSELVRAGLVQRFYKGDYVDHHNRGGQRHAVYIVAEEIRRALSKTG